MANIKKTTEIIKELGLSKEQQSLVIGFISLPDTSKKIDEKIQDKIEKRKLDDKVEKIKKENQERLEKVKKEVHEAKTKIENDSLVESITSTIKMYGFKVEEEKPESKVEPKPEIKKTEQFGSNHQNHNNGFNHQR